MTDIKTTDSIRNNFLNDSIKSYHDSSDVYTFKFNTDTTNYILKSIVIYASGKNFQTINVNRQIEEINIKYQLTDVNFDGYRDIMVLDGCGSGGCYYLVWNYSPNDKKFHFNKDLSDIFGLEIDSVHKLVMFSYSGGWNIKEWDTLKYKNEKLYLVSSRHIDGNDTIITKQ